MIGKCMYTFNTFLKHIDFIITNQPMDLLIILFYLFYLVTISEVKDNTILTINSTLIFLECTS